MTGIREWHFIHERPVNAKVNYVQCDGQVGFPKLGGKILLEKLASDLAELVCVPVARVEIGYLKDWNEKAAISHVHGLNSRPLRTDENPSGNYTQSEISALKIASGLLAFLTWIGSDDHAKDSNYVVEEFEENRIRVMAIDFEHAFPWTSDIKLKDIVNPPRPPGLSTHNDSSVLNGTLDKIEMLRSEEITNCCMKCGMSETSANEMASTLRFRAKELRKQLKSFGFLPS